MFLNEFRTISKTGLAINGSDKRQNDLKFDSVSFHTICDAGSQHACTIRMKVIRFFS